MQDIVSFFEAIPSSYRTGSLVLGLVAFWIAEGAVPLFTISYARFRHAALNTLLTFFQIVVAFSFGVVVVKASQFTSEHHFGLLYLAQLPLWLHVCLGVLIMDFVAGYWIHRIQHSVSWLWGFHIVHHADENVDVTTGLRHHPAETVFRLSSQTLAVLVGGVPIGVVFFYQILSVFFAQLTHANVRSPATIDRYLSWVFVTPNMHKVHHHNEKPLTDTNYGNIFAIWDRLFGTFSQVDLASLNYGIDSLPSPNDHDKLGRLLVMPFQSSGKAEKND